MNRFMLRAAACVALLAGSHVCVQAQENRALVVVNDNSRDSIDVGNYYATSRNIPTDHIVHVRVPNQQFVQTDDFVSLRDQILRFGICPLVPAADRPAACSDVSAPIYTQDTISALTAHAPVGYIVLTKGVPTRFPYSSVDSYLRFTLANYLPFGAAYTRSDLDLLKGRREANLSQDVVGRKRTLTSQIAALRPVDVAQDREYIVGRIDNLDLTTAKAMVDKTLAAQSAGLQGKVYSNRGGFEPDVRFYNYPGADTETWRQMFGFFGESRLTCIDYGNNYLSVKPATDSNAVPVGGQAPGGCKVKISDGLGEEVGSWGGKTYDKMPGNSGSRQPIVDNALIYFGQLDGQAPQGDLAALLNWRKNLTCTNTLCDTAADPAACRAASTDPYKQIDTSCVGVAPGFIGYNERSFTAAHFGIWPQPWGPVTQYGASDAPRIDSTQGADGSYSVWFDYPDDVASPLCYQIDSVNGNAQLGLSTVPCAPKRLPSLAQDLVLLSPGLADKYHVSLNYKALGLNTAVTQKLNVSLSFSVKAPAGGCVGQWKAWATDATTCRYVASQSIDLNNNSNWQQQPITFDLTAADLMIPEHGALEIEAVDAAGLQLRALGLDAISVKRDGSSTELVVNGSFNNPGQYAQIKNASGAVITANDRGANFVAHFLGRLGATAFLGSTGHGTAPWDSEGHSFERHDTRNVWMWMNGIPLGDAVWLGEPVDGVFYGDPLYSPMTVGFLINDDFDGHIGGALSLAGYSINGISSDLAAADAAICPGNDIYSCDLHNAWNTVDVPSFPQGGVTYFKQQISYDASTFPVTGEYILRERFTFRTSAGAAQWPTMVAYASLINRYTQAEQSVYLVKGVVKTSSGYPLPGTKVVINSGGVPVANATTNLAGEYSLTGLAPGSYTLTAQASAPSLPYVFSLAGGAATITITTGSLSGIDLVGTASGGSNVAGIVKNSLNAQPVAGIKVSAYSGSSLVRSWQTTATGAYELASLPAGTYTVKVDDTRWTGQASVVANGSSLTQDLNAVPQAGLSVSGVAHDAAGSPMPNVTMTYWNCADGLTKFTTVTNSAGYFYVPGLVQSGDDGCPNQTVAVRGTAFGYQADSETIQLGGSAVFTMLPLASTEQRSISGYAFKAGTTNIWVGVQLSLVNSSGATVATVKSGKGGFFKFSGVPAGRYTIKQGTTSKAVSVIDADAINVDLAL